MHELPETNSRILWWQDKSRPVGLPQLQDRRQANYKQEGLAMADEPKENKDNMLTLRLNEEQMLAVKQWAHQHNANVSQVIRSAIELMTGAKQ
jgi:predicted DNA binding CopG/RHH family protein